MFQNRLDWYPSETQHVPVDFIIGMYEDGVIPTNKGLRTADELEREAYMNGNVREAALWSMVQDLDTALSVASRLEAS